MIELSKIKNVNCPICKRKLVFEESNMSRGANRKFIIAGINNKSIILSAKCFYPTSQNPLHYYGYFSNLDKPNSILSEEFSVDIGNKTILFANIYFKNESLIWTKTDSEQLKLSFIIEPDYPNLERLKQKLRTAIIFA